MLPLGHPELLFFQLVFAQTLLLISIVLTYVKLAKRPQTTYLSVLRNQLKDKNIKTLESAIEIAQNRQFWDCICGSSRNAEQILQ